MKLLDAVITGVNYFRVSASYTLSHIICGIIVKCCDELYIPQHCYKISIDYIPQSFLHPTVSVGCYHLSMPWMPASGTFISLQLEVILKSHNLSVCTPGHLGDQQKSCHGKLQVDKSLSRSDCSTIPIARHGFLVRRTRSHLGRGAD